MNVDSRLHHYAQQVAPATLEKVIEMYEILGFQVVYRPQDTVSWAMVGQEQLRFAIQIVEYNGSPIEDIEEKRKTHIALISADPQAILDRVKGWAAQNDIRFRSGGWSETERYFDPPDIFLNFVVEVMHTSIEEG